MPRQEPQEPSTPEEPEDEVLGAFLERLRASQKELLSTPRSTPRPAGNGEPAGVLVARTPVPMLHHEEAALQLLGWSEGPLRWARLRGGETLPGEVPPDRQLAALEAMIALVGDRRFAAEHEALGELLRVPAWVFVLGTLDQSLSRLETGQGEEDGAIRGGEERLAFRVTVNDGTLNIQPVVQKRSRGGTQAFSRGARLQWYHLPDRQDLTAADRRVYQAYDDRFARQPMTWGGALTPAQVFGVLRALIDHPAVYFEDQRAASPEGARLDIRQGRLRLSFAGAPDGTLSPRFELAGLALLAPEVSRALRDDSHLVYLHRPEDPGAAPQVLLAQLTPQATAVVRALAVAPARFPPEAHDALAARLEALQESVDMEFPSRWTRTISPADARLIARLELLVSGAVKVALVVRPVKLGPVFAPGEGPGLVLEGQGRDRHGARRNLPAERVAGRALAERLGLGGGAEIEPWRWRVGEGDPALHLVATLAEMGGGEEVLVEWADDDGLLSLGSVSRRNMRMRVADRRDWFAVEGGAEVAGQSVPLSVLLAAIREGRRYVPVGARSFVRIEESLRQALARAEGAVFESRGALQVSAVGSDPLVGLVEAEAQIEASEAFGAVRRRMREGQTETPRLSPALEARLRPYQKAGVQWMARLAHWGAGALLADEMGLGKTVQTLAVLAHRAALGPALVVAPTSVVANWVDEAARFVPELGVRVYRGAERQPLLRGLGPGDLLVTSYALCTMDAEALAGIRFASLVLDEAQAVKNATTERSRSLRGLDAGWRLGLTGTPVENHVGELWSLMRVISPGLLGSWEQFRGRYAVPIEKFGDDSRRQALAAVLRPFLLRRTKSEVARELPPRTEVIRVVRLSAEELELYQQLRQATLHALAREKEDRERDPQNLRFVLLAALTRLRQLCCHPRLVYPRTHATSSKAAHLLELLGELRAGGHRALVFSQFRSFLELLAPRLRQHGFRVLVLDGTTPVQVREERIAAFQREEADVFLISLKAGGFGLNLTAADSVIHLDPWWNPAVEDQATARAHRIGQQRPVTAVRLVAADTIEEAVLGLHAVKRALAAGLLEGSDLAASLGTEELVELIRGGA